MTIPRTILSLLLLCCIPMHARITHAQSPSGGESLEVRLPHVENIVRQSLALIGTPAPENPYNKDAHPERHWQYQLRFEQQALNDADRAVKDFIWECFSSGMPLETLISSTEGRITWSQWPKEFDNLHIPNIRGLQDRAMSDEEWRADDNALVVAYLTHTSESGVFVHLFTNFFRAPKKESTRPCASTYTVVRDASGDLHFADLTWSLHGTAFSPRGASSPEFLSLAFGFLDTSTVPGIVKGWGPTGRVQHFGLTHYAWNERYNLWEGTTLWSSEQVLGYHFDGKVGLLRYFQCLEPTPDGPDTYGCARTLDLREYYLEHKEEIEASRRQNARIGSTLTPPREIYVEPPAPPDEAKE